MRMHCRCVHTHTHIVYISKTIQLIQFTEFSTDKPNEMGIQWRADGNKSEWVRKHSIPVNWSHTSSGSISKCDSASELCTHFPRICVTIATMILALLRNTFTIFGKCFETWTISNSICGSKFSLGKSSDKVSVFVEPTNKSLNSRRAKGIHNVKSCN